jgi:uncharacterized OB-fold protein
MASDRSVICTRCGFANVPGDQFCGSCGAFLEWEGAASAATEVSPAAAPPGPEATAPAASRSQSTPGIPPTATPSGPSNPPAAPPGIPGEAGGTLVRCPSCGIANPASRTFCQTCGAKLSPNATVSSRSRAEIAAAVAAVPGAPPVSAAPATQAAGAAAPGQARRSRGLPRWIAVVVVLGVLAGVAAVAASQLLKGGEPASAASAAPTASGAPAASSSGGSVVPSPSGAEGASPTPAPTSVAGKPLKLTSASASSILNGNTGRYGPQNAIDGSLKTSWQEGAAAEQGQWLEVGFASSTVSAITIRNGYQASTPQYRANLRLKVIQISIDGGPPLTVTLKDATAVQRINLTPVTNATHVRITIVSTYPAVKTSVAGSPFKDAAVSEIGVLGVPAG